MMASLVFSTIMRYLSSLNLSFLLVSSSSFFREKYRSIPSLKDAFLKVRERKTYAILKEKMARPGISCANPMLAVVKHMSDMPKRKAVSFLFFTKEKNEREIVRMARIILMGWVLSFTEKGKKERMRRAETTPKNMLKTLSKFLIGCSVSITARNIAIWRGMVDRR